MNTKIFLLHHLPAVERKINLIKDLNELSIKYPIEWVESFLPEDIYNKYQHSITLNELSLSLKHQYAISQQVKHNIENIIVLEDDISLKSVMEFNLFIDQCLKDIEYNNGDLLWIGGTRDLQVPSNMLQDNCISYFSENFLSRCTHGYILNLKSAEKLLEKYNYNFPVDHLFNQIIIQNKLVSGWTNPFLTQKTVEGECRSYIR